MALAESLIVVGGLLLAALAWAWFAFRRAGAAARADDCQQRRIRVRGGYDPVVTHVNAGAPVRLIFRRDEAAPCSERVVFPDLGISAALPAFRETAVELPASEPGRHGFTCEMQMLHGWVVVDAEGTHTRAAGRDVPAVGA
jgi:Cu+-exporting ATPase